MNEFLKYLLICLEDEKELVSELLGIDNQIQTTTLTREKLVEFVKTNINKLEWFNEPLNERVVILTEGSPILTTKLLNDYAHNMQALFISRYFVGINKWFMKKGNEFFDIDIELDTEDSYDKYLSDDNIMVAGSEGFVNGTQKDFKVNLVKRVTE